MSHDPQPALLPDLLPSTPLLLTVLQQHWLLAAPTLGPGTDCSLCCHVLPLPEIHKPHGLTFQ